MNNPYSDFIKANRRLWSRIPLSKSSNVLLLVEPHPLPYVSHAHAVFARIIKDAKGLSIGWIDTGNRHIQARLLSYDPSSRTIPQVTLTRFEKLIVRWKYLCSALRMILTGDVLGFSLNGIRFGDIVYDIYLQYHRAATMRRINHEVLRTLRDVIVVHYRYRKLLINTGASAVLVSHTIGLFSGVLFRTALGLRLEAYVRSAGERAAVEFSHFSSLDEIYNHQFKPRPSDIEFLQTINSQVILKHFDEQIQKRMRGEIDIGTRMAYRSDKTTYKDRQKFADKFGVDVTKKNVFVMLHAFNDHPRSTFKWMLFRDYYDWFLQTLKFAQNKTDVNWIFKEHPSSKFYPTDDISLRNHFRNCPGHIVFFDAEASFSSKSLLYLADIIITCLGTAGVEFPAARGVPVIIAGNTFYNEFGFTIEPKSKNEYFQVLKHLETIKRLTKKQQYIAKLVFLYIQRYCHVPLDWCPVITVEEEKDPNIDNFYWNRVSDQYKYRSHVLLRQFNDYVVRVGQPDFKRLLDFSSLHMSFDSSECSKLKKI